MSPHNMGEKAFLGYAKMRVTKRIQEEYEKLLRDVGEGGFYDHILGTAVLARKHYDHPENTMMEQGEAFFCLFRTTGNENFFTIGKILRRAAHKLYRDSRNKDADYPANKRFLDIIK